MKRNLNNLSLKQNHITSLTIKPTAPHVVKQEKYLQRFSLKLRRCPSYIAAAGADAEVNSLIDVVTDGAADRSQRRRQLVNITSSLVVVVVGQRGGDQ